MKPLLLLLSVTLGCHAAGPEQRAPIIQRLATTAPAITTTKADIDSTAKIRESLGKAHKIFVYEGLPHQMFEADLLKAEKKLEDTLKIGGFPFYAPKVVAPDKIAKTLRELAASPESYAVFSGEKRCGGFHPDYAATWFDSGKEHSILFCYGCVEALIVDGKKTYRYDFTRIADLRKLLAPFKSKRPTKPKG